MVRQRPWSSVAEPWSTQVEPQPTPGAFPGFAWRLRALSLLLVSLFGGLAYAFAPERRLLRGLRSRP